MGVAGAGTARVLKLALRPEDLDAYLDDLARKGRGRGTLDIYRRTVYALYEGLPADKSVRPGTLARWQRQLVERGYSPRTVNAQLSAVTGLMSFLNRQDLRLDGSLDISGSVRPELTRTEYLRLLSTARGLGRERVYLLVKLFAVTGLAVQELDQVTVERVRSGQIPTGAERGREKIPIPACLREELLDYAGRAGVSSGILFLTRTGKPLHRSNVTDSIRRLCLDARVDQEKGNPRCLHRLYLETQRDIQEAVARLARQNYARLLEEEQRAIGWNR